MSKLDDYIEKATSNVTEDRAATKTLLVNLLKYMQISDDRHKEVGLIAAKYLETLQRSNEQLVKLASLVSKKESSIPGLTDDDREDLFDIIKNTNKSGDTE
tara:strand:+ start:2000 stop:2302 length:303 start_codon:yes stop_codon:yes gene_type:complete